MRTANEPLIVHAAGNDADSGNPALSQPWSPHKHIDDRRQRHVSAHVLLFAERHAAPTVRPPRRSTVPRASTYCEKTKHPTHGANTTSVSWPARRTRVTVGADPDASAFAIAPFSSRGPTTRRPHQAGGRGQGNRPVLDVSEQQLRVDCRRNVDVDAGRHRHRRPADAAVPQDVRQDAEPRRSSRRSSSPAPTTSAIAGPDYTFGFGLADAKASVDLIRDDNGTGSRIRTRHGRQRAGDRHPGDAGGVAEVSRRPRLVRSRGPAAAESATG